LRGPAKVGLPWVKLSFKEDSFFAHSGEVVSARSSYTTPGIESVIEKHSWNFREVDEIDTDFTRIPDVLTPKKEIEIDMEELDTPQELLVPDP